MAEQISIGKYATLLTITDEQTAKQLMPQCHDMQFIVGKIGTMSLNKIIASVETAARRQGIISESQYRETHALYHAILEAVNGITRGELSIGEIMRTVGLKFSIVRGYPYQDKAEGEWIAVSLFGTIGAPIKGKEHETIGLGINHI
ncbi:hut operon transcriptional regulator HutP [Mammaliicoccus sciuri]|uniref:hut operon transcriptional regulator HutP n=1 Tax=Mammaliicoccus sciuri TaxID=1296 RepID=UPI00194E85F4|nr:hut operon transcriptional regulator HutP [Mammaliicoccus sciuri]